MILEGVNFIGNVEATDLDEFQKNKMEWLLNSNYNYETKRSYYSVLDSRVHALEVALNKDLYKFTQVEIENIIKSVNSFSFQTAQALFSIINSYIQWTVEVGMNSKGENNCNKIIIHHSSEDGKAQFGEEVREELAKCDKSTKVEVVTNKNYQFVL